MSFVLVIIQVYVLICWRAMICRIGHHVTLQPKPNMVPVWINKNRSAM